MSILIIILMELFLFTQKKLSMNYPRSSAIGVSNENVYSNISDPDPVPNARDWDGVGEMNHF